MKCKHWERRNRGPVLLVTANATQGSITPEQMDDLQEYLQESTGMPVRVAWGEGLDIKAVVIDKGPAQ